MAARLARLLIALPLAGLGCAPGATSLERCEPSQKLIVQADIFPGNGPADVERAVSNSRISLDVTTEGTDVVHHVEFVFVGEVSAEFGLVVMGEGDEVIYLRLVDEIGLVFEGGRSPIFDDDVGGGADIASPFAPGSPTGARCNNGLADVDLLDVQVALDGQTVTAPPEGVAGRLGAVDVLAAGIRAESGSFVATQDAIDGYTAGFHTVGDVVGYLYRVP